MTRADYHNELRKVLYIEDTNIVDTLTAVVLANTQQLGDPVWLTIIGPSSGGKSQFIRPMARGNPGMFLRIDDLTANTFLSATLRDNSLLMKYKTGIISMDDLTVLFSKNSEDRNAILSQMRMIYDGRMSKGSGNNAVELVWEGFMGMIAGSTPSIYRHFAEVADMGERFVSYRMKNMDEDKVVEFVQHHNLSARDADGMLTEVYKQYLGELIASCEGETFAVDPKTQKVINNIAKVGTKLRTPVLLDDRDGHVLTPPVSELPMRVMKQLQNLAIGFTMMHWVDTGEKELPKELQECIEWVGWSLADDNRRNYVRAVIGLTDQGKWATARNVSAHTGLHHTVCERGLSTLTAIGVLSLSEDDTKKRWEMRDRRLVDIVHRLDPPKLVEIID